MRDVREYAREIKGGRRCLICPFRSINAPYRFRDILRLRHIKGKNWGASGRKQRGICVALSDFDKL